jgi:c-di-GMP-binding flagellar brake protein YcgR
MEMLSGINHKLDLILSTISQDMLVKDFPLRLEITEISGAGVLFSTNENIEIGDHLEMVLILSQFPLRLASVCGTVQRQENLLFAFNFIQIRENDRETIVQFVFQEQREQIRESKHAY